MWYHGSPFTYAQPECPRVRDASCHWNALLGFHFTRNLTLATRFREGLHHEGRAGVGEGAPGILLTLTTLPGRGLHVANEYLLEDAVAASGLRAGVFTGKDLQILWDYDDDESIDPALTLEGIVESLQNPERQDPFADQGSRLIGDLRDYGVEADLLELRSAQVQASILAFLCELAAQGYSHLTYANVHEDETQHSGFANSERCAIIPHVRQLQEDLSPPELLALFQTELTAALARLARARHVPLQGAV